MNNHLLTGLLLSNLCFLIGLKFFKQFNNINNLTIIFILLFPTSFFFGALYTEGLFFLLVVLVLWGLQRKKYRLVAVAGFLAALTRFIGVFLIIPIGFHLISESQKSKVKSQSASWRTKVKNINNTHISRVSRYTFRVSRFFHLLTPILGLLTYMAYLWKTTGDPLFFFNTQPIFGANRSTHLIFLPQVYYRYFKIFLTATPDFQYFISIFEFLIFNFMFIIICIQILRFFRHSGPLRRSYSEASLSRICLGRSWSPLPRRGPQDDNAGLIFFSLINILLPTFTGTFSSIPRYALMSLSVFIYLGKIKRNWIKIIIGCFFGILHIIVLGFFIQGYFVG